MMDKRSRIPGHGMTHWFGIIRTWLAYGVAILVAGLIVLKIVPHLPIISNWPHDALIAGYAGKALVGFSLLLVLNEFMVTRHPHYDVWLLAALGGIIGVLAW